MRTLTFEQITDSRFNKDIAGLLRERKRRIMEKLKTMNGVQVEHAVTRHLEWPDGSEQFRCRFYVRKTTRRYTWNDVYRAVNSVHPVPYKFVHHNWKEAAI